MVATIRTARITAGIRIAGIAGITTTGRIHATVIILGRHTTRITEAGIIATTVIIITKQIDAYHTR